jgi:phosphatidylserine/phosphatidylglycerophosphate/cardiolipin synthase-like enzyme
MNRLFSNGPLRDFVYNPLARLINAASRLHLAAPYFTRPELIINAARAGKSVQLLIGLNSSTSPDALSAIHGIPNLAVRYLTHRFHAKIYILDDIALLGSSNLTDGGLVSNREAVICLDQPEDAEAVEEARGLFLELWESAQVLTTEKLGAFKQAFASIRRQGPDPDAVIENAVGRAEPININVDSHQKTRERIFLEELRRRVYEQYRPAFDEVARLLEGNGLRRPELESVGIPNETNRFLGWVRLTYVVGDEAWQSAPLQSQDTRRTEIIRLGEEWVSTTDSKVPEDF